MLASLKLDRCTSVRGLSFLRPHLPPAMEPEATTPAGVRPALPRSSWVDADYPFPQAMPQLPAPARDQFSALPEHVLAAIFDDSEFT